MDYNAVSTLIQDLEEAQSEKEQLVVDLEERPTTPPPQRMNLRILLPKWRKPWKS